MKQQFDEVVERLLSHAWGTEDASNPHLLADSMWMLEHGKAIDFDSLRSKILGELQQLNIEMKPLQMDVVPKRLAFAINQMIVLILEQLLLSNDANLSKDLALLASDIGQAWYWILSGDIDSIEEGI